MSTPSRHRAVLLYGFLASPAVLFVVWTMGAAPRVAALVAATERPAAFGRLEGRLEEQRRARREARNEHGEHHLAATVDGTEVNAWRERLQEALRVAFAEDASWTSVDLWGPEVVASMGEFKALVAHLDAGGAAAREALAREFECAEGGRIRVLLTMLLGELGVESALRDVAGIVAAGHARGNRAAFEAACYALGRYGTAPALASLTALTEQQRPDWQWSIPLHRAAAAHGAAAVPFLLAEVERLRAAGAPLDAHLVLGGLRGQGAREALLELLAGTHDAATKPMAAYALGALLASADEALVREQLAGASGELLDAWLAGLGRSDAGGSIVAGWLGSETDPARVRAGVFALASVEGPEAVEALLALFPADGGFRPEGLLGDAEVRRGLMAALASKADPRAKAQLVGWFEAGDADTRRALVDAVKSAPPAEFEPLLAARLGDLDGLTSDDVAATLCALAGATSEPERHAATVLGAFHAADDEGARRNVLAALGPLMTPTLARELLPALEASGDLMTRVFAAEVASEAGRAAGGSSNVAGWRELERRTLDELFDTLRSGRISRMLLSNPDTRLQFGEATRRFIGRVATDADRTTVEELIRRYRPLGQSSTLSNVLQRSLERIEARHGILG